MLRRYERVCFEWEHVRLPGKAKADLLSPGHPLLDAVVDLIVERYGTLLKQGTVLVDGGDQAEEPRLLVALTQSSTDAHSPARTVSKRFHFIEIDRAGGAASAGPAPYLGYRPIRDDERPLLSAILAEPWLASGVEDVAVSCPDEPVATGRSTTSSAIWSTLSRASSSVTSPPTGCGGTGRRSGPRGAHRHECALRSTNANASLRIVSSSRLRP